MVGSPPLIEIREWGPAGSPSLPRKTTTKPRNYLTATQVHSLADESKHPDIILLLATTGLR